MQDAQSIYRPGRIDTVQWHLEDIIRDPHIDPQEALVIKRRIDRSNQERTDLVERIDSYFLEQFQAVTPQPDARINTESPCLMVQVILNRSLLESAYHRCVHMIRLMVVRNGRTEDTIA